MNEANTYRRFVAPKLRAGGWDNDPHSIGKLRVSEADAVYRAERVKKQSALFNFPGPAPGRILDGLLEAYASDGELRLAAVRKHLPNVLKLPPVSDDGNMKEILSKFGGPGQLSNAVNQLHSLYA
jgi:hypothetical protein